MRLGAAEVVALPAPPASVARAVLAHVLTPSNDGVDEMLVGATPAICRLKRELRAVAAHDVTVLIHGETGTGKGVVARLLHESSPRSFGPFVHVDCGALAETVIESELFGHERGAFTGAVARRQGYFEAAAGGTVFVDEVGELPLHLQVKLLRVLEERTYQRVGGTSSFPMTARVVAATHRDLEHEMRVARFREDLYYRLQVFELRLPPLRDRLPDLPLLVRHGLEDLAAKLRVEVPRTTACFYRALERHPWPGNVRELLHVLERALLSPHQGVFDEACLGDPLGGSGRAQVPSGLRGVRGTWAPADDPREVREVLIACDGNLSRAARRLDLPRSTLRERVLRFGLTPYVGDGRRRARSAGSLSAGEPASYGMRSLDR